MLRLPQRRLGVSAAPLALLLLACPPARDARDAHNDAAQPACPQGRDAVLRTELSFGLSRASGPAISEQEFTAFFEQEVTERFSQGSTIIAAEGRYRDKQGQFIREQSKVVIWLHSASPRHELAIETVRARYRALFAQESVLRADTAACVSY